MGSDLNYNILIEILILSSLILIYFYRVYVNKKENKFGYLIMALLLAFNSLGMDSSNYKMMYLTRNYSFDEFFIVKYFKIFSEMGIKYEVAMFLLGIFIFKIIDYIIKIKKKNGNNIYFLILLFFSLTGILNTLRASIAGIIFFLFYLKKNKLMFLIYFIHKSSIILILGTFLSKIKLSHKKIFIILLCFIILNIFNNEIKLELLKILDEYRYYNIIEKLYLYITKKHENIYYLKYIAIYIQLFCEVLVFIILLKKNNQKKINKEEFNLYIWVFLSGIFFISLNFIIVGQRILELIRIISIFFIDTILLENSRKKINLALLLFSGLFINIYILMYTTISLWFKFI